MVRIRKTPSEVYKMIINGDLFEKRPDLLWWKEYNDKGFNYYQIMDGKTLLDTWPEDVTIYVTGNIPVDIMRGGPYYTVVSDKVKKVINYQWKGKAEFLPVKVVHHENATDFGPYWVLNVINVLDALDEENTIWSNGRPPAPYEPPLYVGIIKPALKREIIQKEGIFRIIVRGQIYGSNHFTTHHLRKELEKAKATLGMDFLPVKVV